MNNIRLGLIFTTIFLLTIFLMVTKLSVTVSANTVTPPSREDVYKYVPKGLKLDGLIEHPNYENGTNDLSVLTKYPTNIIEMLSEDKPREQISSFWGKKYKGTDNSKPYNSFRLDKPQIISAWLYLGDTYHEYNDMSGTPDGAGKSENKNKTDKELFYDKNRNENKTADGLALVLQDDNRGAKAISTAIYGKNKGNPSTGETLGVWGGSSSDHSPLNVPFGVTNLPDENRYLLNTTGIQNSFALELDAVQNYKYPSVDTNLIGQKLGGYDDYFDANDNFKGQHITAGYPGDPDTYTSTMKHFGVRSVYYYFEQNNLTGTSNNVDLTGYYRPTAKYMNLDKSWKHLTFKYFPPYSEQSTHGHFQYSFNDEKRDGTATDLNDRNSGYGDIDLTKLKKDGHFNDDIRWGFTASTGSQYSAARTYAIVMQQMPNTANIDGTARLFDMSEYDKNGELGREISDMNQDEDYNSNISGVSTVLAKDSDYNVANNDKLMFQYDLNYESGTMDSGDITAKANLPKNIDFKPGLSNTIGDQSIGKIVYSGAGHDSDNPQEILANDIKTDANGIQYLDLKYKGLDTAGQRITLYLYGQAVTTTTPKLIEGKTASYQSEYYVADVTTPVFAINDQLQISADNKDQTIPASKDANISGKIHYANGATFDGKKVKVHTKINGKEIDSSTAETVSGAKEGSYMMAASGVSLKSGKNTVEVYVIDALERVSNTITYTITVLNRELDLTAVEKEQTIHDNQNVKLHGSYAYIDNSDFSNKITSIKYQITNSDGTKQAEVLQDVTDKITNQGKFTIELEPIGAKLFAEKRKQSVDEYLDNATGLKVGRNEINVVAYDGDTSSNSVNYVVDVPDFNPSIEATKPSLMAIANLPLKLPMNFIYSENYLLQAEDLAVFVQADGSSENPVMTVANRPLVSEKPVSTPYALNPKSSWTNEMVAGDYNLTAYVRDRYLRKTNSVSYKVKVLPTGAQVEVADYHFKPIDPQGKSIPTYVKRDGSWAIEVDSYKAKWSLHARADNMKRQDSSGHYTEPSNLKMVQMDDVNGVPISLADNPTIASGDSTNLNYPVSSSIFDYNSDPNKGILLETKGLPLAGVYQSSITWTLNDTI